MSWYSTIIEAHVDQFPADDLCSYLLATKPTHEIRTSDPKMCYGHRCTEFIAWELTPKMREYVRNDLLSGKEFCHDCSRENVKFKTVDSLLKHHGFPFGLLMFTGRSLVWYRSL